MSYQSELALLREQRLAKLRQATGTPARFAADFTSAKPPISSTPPRQEKKNPGVSWRSAWMFCALWMNFRKMMEVMIVDRELANVLGLAATILAVLMWRLWNRRRASCDRAEKDPTNARIGQSGDDADRRLGRGPGVSMRIGGRGRR